MTFKVTKCTTHVLSGIIFSLFILFCDVPAAPAVTESETWVFQGYAVGKNAGNDPQVSDVMMADVIRLDDGSYRMYYGAALLSGLTAIKYAESSDGKTWEVKGIALSGASSTNDPEYTISGPSVLKLPDGRYRMYYQSSPQIGQNELPKFHVRSAISNDGINFTREGVRININSYDSSSTLRLAGHGTYFIASDGNYVGIFSGEFTSDPTGPSDLKMATSSDGLTFSNFKTLYTDWHDPIVLRTSEGYKLYATYLLESQGTAFSSDGLTWPSQMTTIKFQDTSGNILTEENSGVGDLGGVVLSNGSIIIYANYGNPSKDIVYFTAQSCTYSISPSGQSFPSSGGTGSVSVTASSSSCAWTVTESLDWVTITSGSSGTGSGTVNYSVSINTSTSSRTGNMTIAGQTFTISQTDTVFADVSSSYWAYSYIIAIYNAGITKGCIQSPLTYCPETNVTRGQMAAFIVRALYGENFTFTQTPYFTDVPEAHTFFKYVQRLKDDGITAVTGTFYVDREVTRGEMAAFIIRAKYGETFTYTTTPYFTDVPSNHDFFKYVQKLKDDNITAVTGTYYVDSIVTRAQMAAFIYRAFLSRGPWPMFHHDSRHTGQSTYNGPQTNNLKWSYTRSDITDGTVPNSSSISTDGSTIYVTAADMLLALDTTNGQLIWSVSIGGGGGTAVASDGTVYAVGGKKLYAFTSAGTSKWVFSDPTENIFGEPSIGSNGTIYIGSWDTYVYAVKTDGTLKWKYQTGGSIAPLASPTLSRDGSTVYVGSGDRNKTSDGTLYALNSSDGALKWSVKIDQMRASGAVVGPDGTIYVCGNGRVNAFNSSGTQLWQSAQDTASNLTPAFFSGGIVYVGTAQGKVYAIDAANGQTKWSYQTGKNSDPAGPQYGVLTAPVIGTDGTVYVGAVDGKMYALKSDDTLLWSYQTGKSIHENSPSIGQDGTLYFSSTDKYLYAIKD